MRTVLYYLLIIGSLTGCAALGTKTNFTDSDLLPTITRVALITTKVSVPSVVPASVADSLFVKNLATQLTVATGWQVDYLGEVDAFLSDMGSADNTIINSGKYQAVVHAELALAYYGVIGNVPRFNASTRMQIFNLPSKTRLGESYFNTLMGNSYKVHPILQVAITDGVTGMVRPWQKKLTQLRETK
ncbi:hypothetical protein [Hymenobacter arizonensis]|uniref:Uncharacterized protein n=1 Tax=Hymenobacter arizonensis TaxID=1227077 RepID=A0A1I6AVC9_HYMAR|nr:hypothetical protein [Hymenobacter arizonensis]SFQ72626.1 hypothetical protein SAMN04515668_3936 [Hymenobacter arizonensis]